MEDWIEKASNNLVKLSESSTYREAIKEWEYIYLTDNLVSNESCGLCDHAGIRYEYLVENIINNNQMVVGSECIKKFINIAENESTPIIVKSNRQKLDKNYLSLEVKRRDKKIIESIWTTYIATMPAVHMNFHTSILNEYLSSGKLTPKQIHALKFLYNKLSNEERKVFIKNINVKLTRDKDKKQIINGEVDIEFVRLFMSYEQRKKY